MNKNKKKKLATVLLVLVLILGVSIGYAVLESNLEINGSATIKQTSFNVTFTDVQVTAGSVEINTTRGDKAATIVGVGNNNSIEYNVTLEEPGDYYEFIATVTNNGTLPAKWTAQPTMTTLDANQQKYATYSVTNTDGSALPTYTAEPVLNPGGTRQFKVKVQYRTDIAAGDLPSTAQTIGLTFNVNYGQA